MTFKIGVLASTRGTDLQAIFDEIDAGLMLGIEVSVVASNVEDCGALEKAQVHGTRAVFVNPAGKSREEFDKELVKALGDVDLVCLIGYMKILTPVFVKAFEGKIINVHPALLPKYGGKGFYGENVHEAVLKNGEKMSGMTIHYVTEDVDGGPILLQKTVEIEPGETAESLKNKVQMLEKKYYPEAIRMVYNRVP
jgi:phosphoribosylglycinamide formyltransferase-1